MSKPIRIDFVADVADYLRSVKKVEVSTEDVADALLNASNDAQDLERKLGKATKAAEKDVESLERVIKDLPKSTDKASKDMVRDMGKVEDEFGEIGRDAGQEFQSNLGEAVSSGSVDDILQGTLGGLVGSLSGPIGLAAAGIAGVVGFAFTKMREQAEEEKARIEELMGSLTDAVANLYEQGIRNATRVEELQAFTDWTDENVANIADMAENAEKLGLNVDDITAAAFRGGETWEVTAGVLAEQVTTMRDLYGIQSDQYKTAVDLAQQASDLNETRKEEEDRQGRINDATQTYAELLGLADTNADGIIDDLDAVNAETGEAVGQAQTYADNLRTWESPILAARDGLLSMEEAVRRLTQSRHVAWIEWRNTGAGAAYLDPGNVNYSPGHVAINNQVHGGSR